MDVSENSGTLKLSILIGFSIINHPTLHFSRPPPSVGESWVDAFASVEPHEWIESWLKVGIRETNQPTKKKRVWKILLKGWNMSSVHVFVCEDF